MDPITWEALDPRAPGLVSERLVLHHALQPVAAVGQSLLPVAGDDGQQALSVGPPGRLLGAPVAGGRLRAGLDLVSLELLLCGAGGAPLARFPLPDRTLDEALGFLGEELARRGERARLTLPSHPEDFPRHPLGHGAAFASGDPDARRELARLFEGSALLLGRLGGGAAPRLWPHHFDLATSVQAGALTFGLGVSPGDGLEGGPYWYATPWPHPPREALPPLDGGGRWREAGWFGAELQFERLRAGAEAQVAQVAAFFRSALAAAEAGVPAHP